MQLYPNLTFNGQCEAAFKFYEECLDGRTVFMMTYENAPMDLKTPSEWQKKIFHATFALAEFMFAGSDAPPGQYQKPQGFTLQVNLNDPVKAYFQGPVRQRNCSNGPPGDILGASFWCAR